jgi:hypothetical protein
MSVGRFPFKVYFNGELIATTKYGAEAAAVVGMRGRGGVVLYDGWIIFREGYEDPLAADSWDLAEALMDERIKKREVKRDAH